MRDALRSALTFAFCAALLVATRARSPERTNPLHPDSQLDVAGHLALSPAAGRRHGSLDSDIRVQLAAPPPSSRDVPPVHRFALGATAQHASTPPSTWLLPRTSRGPPAGC